MIVSVIVLSGLLLETAKLSSYSAFKRMVNEYGDFDEDGDDLKALESYWSKNFALVKEPEPFLNNKELLERGQGLHEMSCSSCHTNPKWAFLSYGVNRAIKPALFSLDKSGISLFLWYIHIIFTFGGLAYLPFSKMFHIITTPLSLVLNDTIKEGISDKNNIESSLILSLDACTHCGMCTDTCLVAICFEQIPNPNILPSEKIGSIKRFLYRKELPEQEIRSLLEGLEICTNCMKCTSVCPSGINLQRLWFYMRERFYEMGYGEISMLSPVSLYRFIKLNGRGQVSPSEIVLKSMNKIFEEYYEQDGIIDISKVNIIHKKGLLGSSSHGGTFSYCYNCKTCTVSCPVVRCSDEVRVSLGLVPHQIMHALSLGLFESIFKSPMLWKCLGCYQCQDNCPQGVQITDIFYELKNMARSIIKERNE